MSVSKQRTKKNQRIYLSIFLLLAAAFLIGCESTRDGITSPSSSLYEHFNIDTVRIEVQPSSREEFLRFKYDLDSTEEIFLRKDSQLVYRHQDSLFLQLDNGSRSIWINFHSDEDENYVDYEYMGRLDNLGHYILNASYSEWRNYILVNPIDGDTTLLCGYPELSPNRTLIAAGNSDLFSGFSFNGLQLFAFRNGVLHEVGEKELDWGVEDLYWEDSLSIVVQRNVYDSSLVELQTTDYVKLLLEFPKKR